VRLAEGYLEYDRVIVSPGIDFQTERIDGLGAAGDAVLHAWKAGPQTVALARQLEAMSDGGVVVMTVPPVAYRCPPGPYERACQLAWYLKARKPRSKLIVLDANQDVVSKGALFKAAWRAYPNLEYRPTSVVNKVDAGARTVTTEFGDTVKYDVVNVIPPQRAAAIAVQSGLVSAEGRWCEVDHVTYESAKAKDVHVIGDATIGLPVPKSGTMANSQGKIVAYQVVGLLSGRAPVPMPPVNVCYSWVSDREAVAVVNAYRIAGGKVVQIEQKLTPGQSEAVGRNALAWASSIWGDMLA
jgi:NADPH-dependent 2,4-dienoyl-CoA reductase/sulfur reductase-like enzyme